MNNILKRLIYLSIFLIFFNFVLFANNHCIDYYGIVSQELDNHMAKMTSDLYYTQLSELQNYTIYDMRTTACRSTIPDFNSIDTDNLIFYSEIKKSENDKWTVSFILVDNVNKEQFSKSKTYDTFYKILIESKNELKDTVKELIQGNSQLKKEIPEDVNSISSEKSVKMIKIKSIEELSGTWKGEDSIDKIVILRGGRGFVIFENGVSMNITIKIEDKNNSQIITIQQKGNSNASYFPELPRKIALDAALSAPPIKWTMSLFEGMIMKGVKTTLIQDNQSYQIGAIPVIWEKIN